MRSFLVSAARGVASLLQPPACPSCGCRVEPASDPCPACDRGLGRLWDRASLLPPEPNVLAALSFEGEARDLVHRMKYGGLAPAFRELAHLMAARLLAEGPALEAAALVPVPLHPVRFRERGFNQAERLARGVSRRLGLAVDPGLLGRIKPTLSQTKRNQEARRRAVDGVFRVTRPVPDGRTLIIVDDVWTTGATAEACRGALLSGGAAAPVWVLVAARTPYRVPIETQSRVC